MHIYIYINVYCNIYLIKNTYFPTRHCLSHLRKSSTSLHIQPPDTKQKLDKGQSTPHSSFCQLLPFKFRHQNSDSALRKRKSAAIDTQTKGKQITLFKLPAQILLRDFNFGKLMI